MNLAGELLERAARATPAAAEDRGSGWWIRYTDGNAWWSGAVLAHDAWDDGRLAERIEVAERFYAGRDAAARFQVCPGCPPGPRPSAARLVLSAIARWAREQDAPRLYLQVERSNTAACRLYADAGFTEVATYHYRVRDVAGHR